MNERFLPPKAEVADAHQVKPTSLGRTVMVVVCTSLISLALAWFVAPLVAGSIVVAVKGTSSDVPPEFLVLDLLFSTLVFVVGCYLAAKLARRHGLFAAAATGVAGAVVNVIQFGGVSALASSDFPAWYKFFPSHLVAAVLGIILARRSES